METQNETGASLDHLRGALAREDDRLARAAGEPAAPPQAGSDAAAPNPDDPPWGVGMALLAWFGSLALLVVFQIVALVAYFVYHLATHTLPPLSTPQEIDRLAHDPGLIFITIAFTVPAHIATFALAWAIITGFAKRSFQQTVGWGWGAGFGFWRSAGLAVLLLIVSTVIVKLGGAADTDIDKIVASSVASRYTVAFLAAVTAPLVEEVIYRGILFPALRRAAGVATAVVIVSVLFAGVHVFQYRNSLSVIAAILLLSVTLTLVRAYTRRLLPCFVIHMVFNGVQSVLLIASPYFERFTVTPKPQGFAALATLLRLFN